MGLWEKAANIAARDGPRAALLAGLGYVYNRTVWPWLPSTDEWVQFNGVKMRRRKFGDAWIPIPTLGSDRHLDYEVVLGRAIREHVTAGDSVLEVAGGLGVTTTIAARQVGEAGEVLMVEGSAEQAREARRTITRNGVADRVTIRNWIVGSSSASVRSTPPDHTATIAPAELPRTDVFVIDCDGCEHELLDAVDAVDPERIIVEHHAVLNIEPTVEYDPSRIRTLLESRGYAVVAAYTQLMEAKNPEFGDEETVFVAER
jgi:hypothetical protein